MKTLGRLKYFLEIEVFHSKKGIFVSQQKYVTDLLKETGMTACKPLSIPMNSNLKLGNEDESAEVDKEIYQRLVGIWKIDLLVSQGLILLLLLV